LLWPIHVLPPCHLPKPQLQKPSGAQAHWQTPSDIEAAIPLGLDGLLQKAFRILIAAAFQDILCSRLQEGLDEAPYRLQASIQEQSADQGLKSGA